MSDEVVARLITTELVDGGFLSDHLRLGANHCAALFGFVGVLKPLPLDALQESVTSFEIGRNIKAPGNLERASGSRMLRILTDRGTEYCGRLDEHPYQLFLAINDIDHTKTKVKSPQTNGICERFHQTILQESYQVTFRKKLYGDLDELQADLDPWPVKYNEQRSHQGKMCCGRTPKETFEYVMQIWREKEIGGAAA